MWIIHQSNFQLMKNPYPCCAGVVPFAGTVLAGIRYCSWAFTGIVRRLLNTCMEVINHSHHTLHYPDSFSFSVFFFCPERHCWLRSRGQNVGTAGNAMDGKIEIFPVSRLLSCLSTFRPHSSLSVSRETVACSNSLGLPKHCGFAWILKLNTKLTSMH